MDKTSGAGPATTAGIDRGVIRIAVAVISGGIAVIFDSTIVSVALKDLTIELHTTVSTIQWVSTGYLLAMFVAIPATGWLQARVGGKRLWLASLGLFLLGSVLCATAWDAPSLIVFRVVQGLGGGVMMPLMITLIMQAAHGQSLGRLMAVIGLPVSLGPILGPVLGGAIIGSLDWRWIFLVNVPVCAVGAFLAWRMLPSDRPRAAAAAAFDPVGFVLLAAGTTTAIYGLSDITKDGGAARVDFWLPVAVGIALLAGFTAWAVPRGPRAIIDVHLLKHRPLAVASFLMMLLGAALYGSMLLIPLFLQELRGQDALGAGLFLIPQGIGALLSRSTGGRATDEIGPRPVAIAGFVVMAVATVPFAFASATTPSWWLLLVLLVRGFGQGLVFTPIMALAYVGLDRTEIPDASIITRVTQQLGGSVGTAVLAVVLESAVGSAHDTAGLAHGFDVAFWWAVGFTAVATAMSFLLPRRPAVPAPTAATQDAA